MKKILAKAMAGVCLLALFPMAATAAPTDEVITLDSGSNNGIDLKMVTIADGMICNQICFSYNAILNKNNGRTVNFWIQNKGSTDMTTNINNQVFRTFAPGEQGHISASVSQTSQKFTFSAYPTYGGLMSMTYLIRQR